MKRACALLLTLLLLGPTATADVLIEPSDDFYRTHAEECEYLDRSYTANGKEGYVALYQSPKSSRQRETVAACINAAIRTMAPTNLPPQSRMCSHSSPSLCSM